jgi:hypothetical protein
MGPKSANPLFTSDAPAGKGPNPACPRWPGMAMAETGIDKKGPVVDKTEMAKVERYLRQTFANHSIRVVGRPKKTDSAEVYIGEEFVGVLFVDDEDGDRSYNFTMAILDTDIED